MYSALYFRLELHLKAAPKIAGKCNTIWQVCWDANVPECRPQPAFPQNYPGLPRNTKDYP